MELTKKFLLLLLQLFLSLHLYSQVGHIKGRLTIDTAIWAPVVYLSIISDFDNLYTISNEMIIEKAELDQLGQFFINTQFLPKEDHLYRLHISKKKDSPASIIIGGKEENHFFIVGGKNTNLMITDTSQFDFLKDVRFDGYYPNKIIQKVDEIAGYLDSANFNGSSIKTELIKGAIFEKLRLIADTCSNPVVSLYALYKSKFENNYSINQQFYRNYLSKWKKQQSSYFVEFRKKIPPYKSLNSWYLIFICCFSFGLGVILTFLYKKSINKKPNIIENLSIQERKIYALIVSGKSNKEISEELNIGLSTVKTHINSIYSKLDINSRKEVLNLNQDKS